MRAYKMKCTVSKGRNITPFTAVKWYRSFKTTSVHDFMWAGFFFVFFFCFKANHQMQNREGAANNKKSWKRKNCGYTSSAFNPALPPGQFGMLPPTVIELIDRILVRFWEFDQNPTVLKDNSSSNNALCLLGYAASACVFKLDIKMISLTSLLFPVVFYPSESWV